MITPAVRPKRPVWLLWTTAAASLILGLWTMLVLLDAHQPGATGDAWGLAFGIVAAALSFAQLFYPLRRRWMARPFRTAQDWLQFHVYASSLAFAFALAHVGPRLPAGFLGWTLLVAIAWTFASGLGGVLLQKSLPPMIALLGTEHVPYERLPQVAGRLRDDADAVAESAPPAVKAWYQSEIRARFDGVRVSWLQVLRRGRSEEATVRHLFDRAPSVAGGEPAQVQRLRVIVEEKVRLDTRASLQRALRSWLLLHVPAALALAALILWHLFAVAYF